MGQLTKHAKKLWKSVEIKYEGPRTEGQECEGNVVVLEHSGNAVDLIEVGGDKVASVVYVKDLEITRGRTGKVVMDKCDVVEEIMKQSTEMPACGRTPSQPKLRVNLAGISAGNHPRQSQKNLWVRHTTRKVVQGQIISRMKKGKVVDQVAGTKKTVNVMIYKLSLIRKYRLVQMDRVKAEVMAIPGVGVMAESDSVVKQVFKKCKGFLFLFCRKL